MLTVHSGELHCFSHETDRGNTATKYFCPTCGSQLFTRNSANSGRRGIRVGTITDASWFQPSANVYAGRRLPSTPIDDEIKAFDEMPD